MKNLEVFYTAEEAQQFAGTLNYDEADPEVIHTYETDEADNEFECWAVYFNPRKMR